MRSSWSSSIIFNYWLGLDLYQACSLDDLYFFLGSVLFLFVDKQIEVALAFELQVDLDQRFDGQAHVSWLMCCMGCMVCMICMGCMCCCQSRSHFTWFQSRFKVVSMVSRKPLERFIHQVAVSIPVPSPWSGAALCFVGFPRTNHAPRLEMLENLTWTW